MRLLSVSCFWSVVALMASVSVCKAAPPVAAQEGHGGDICEDRIKVIRDDIDSWIRRGGSANLKLPEGVTHDQYSAQMFAQLQQAKVVCTDQVVQVAGVEKTCKNSALTVGNGEIECNVHRFLTETSDSDQYVLIHHEYAGLAELELGPGSDSEYKISNQISDFLENQVIKKLSVVSHALSAGSDGRLDFVDIPMKNYCGNKTFQGFACFPMGHVKHDAEGWWTSPDEGAADRDRPVSFTRPFQMQSTPVTQKLWFEIMGHNPAHFSNPDACPSTFVTVKAPDGPLVSLCPNNPVEQVSVVDDNPALGGGYDVYQSDISTFLKKLNGRNDGFVYSLPTEAEWEYAARAGNYVVDQMAPSDLPGFAWFWDNSTGRTHEVAQKQPNAYGLFDMQGNVQEWVSDWYDPKYGQKGKPGAVVTDPIGPAGPSFSGGWALSTVRTAADTGGWWTPNPGKSKTRPDMRGWWTPTPSKPNTHADTGGWWTPSSPAQNATPTDLVVRGGSYNSQFKDMRLTTRSHVDPTHLTQELGFRLVRRRR